MDITTLYQLFLKHPQITTDTRETLSDAIFFALKGANFNGNQFAGKALAAGAAYAVVDEVPDDMAEDERIIKVDDVLTTLQNLATYHRRRLGLPIVQITGTNGKTTTKELVSAVLQQKYNVLFTQGNFNNHIGVPKTLLRMTKEHDLAVIETGANHPGEIKQLSEIVEANYGLITNVGKAHLEGFGSFEGVIRTKTELYDYLRFQKAKSPEVCSEVFLNADNPWLTSRVAGLSTLTYGCEEEERAVQGKFEACCPFLKFSWRKKGGEWNTVETHLIGKYNLDNLLAAVAVGLQFEVPEADICKALSTYVPTNHRSEWMQTAHNFLIVDAYNANPTSMAAALDNFKQIDHPHKMMILGGMKELGATSEEEHDKIIDLLKTMSVEQVWLVGDEFRKYAGEFKHFNHVDEVTELLQQAPLQDYLILIKGSNSQKLFMLPQNL